MCNEHGREVSYKIHDSAVMFYLNISQVEPRGKLIREPRPLLLTQSESGREGRTALTWPVSVGCFRRK